MILGFKSFAFTEYLYFIDAQALGVTTSAALIGGIVSIATRIKESTRFRDLDPITTFWTIFLKPLIGVVGAIFLLCVFASDLITVAGVDVDHAIFTFDEKKFDINERYKALYLLWAIGFVAGFSERFAWDFLTKVQARLEPSAVPSKDNPVKV